MTHRSAVAAPVLGGEPRGELGSIPGGGDFARGLHELNFLVASGVPEKDARMALIVDGLARRTGR
ncbi:hypothetical protein [Cryptosporangium sp. NPDC048952]|uniref:hypothetical protein n=1 Tax=Cryptosporangium sp. NPDC048952 TaxID=3363961 RepID=UPI00371B316A